MFDHIDGLNFGSMVIGGAAAITINKKIINELNVFPVPDGDTGTNMSMTMNTAANELRKKCPEDIGGASAAAAGMLLRGARGNSGVILSLLFRGMAKSLKGERVARAYDLAVAMNEGVHAAYSAIMKPTEGTILTVSRLASEAAAEFALDSDDIEAMLERSIEAAKEALAETINQNPVLKKAGVIDAGGKGYVIILEGMLKALRGDIPEAPEAGGGDSGEAANFSDFDTGDITFAYCTEFIVSRESDKGASALRSFLDARGDSLVLVDDDEIIKVHVHTNEPGAVLTEALTYGPLITVKVENMREQHSSIIEAAAESGAAGAQEERAIAPAEKKYGAVAVCAGEGMQAVFLDIGADSVITGGQTMNPSMEDILRAIDRTPSEVVYVLPNNKNIILTAEQCVRYGGDKKVIVIPTTTTPQGISALLMLDAEAGEQSNTSEMTDAAARVSTISVTYAARDAEFDGHEIKEGDYLALLDGSLLCVVRDEDELMSRISQHVGGLMPEFISVFYGEGVDEKRAAKSASELEESVPSAEVTLIDGGQPVYYYLISIE